MSQLQLNFEVTPKRIDFESCPYMDGLFISLNDSHMRGNIYLPKTLNELQICGKYFLTGDIEASQHSGSRFDLACIINPGVCLGSIKLSSLILGCSNNDWSSPTVNKLETSGIYDNLVIISKHFPQLRELTVHEPKQDELMECLKQLRFLKKLSIGLSQGSSFSVEKLWSNNWPFTIEADRPGDAPYLMEFFQNGYWERHSMR
jgi:hypothetical protein